MEDFREARRYDYTIGNICERAVVMEALDGVDAVVHLAAVVGYPACDADPELAWSTNVLGTNTLLEILSDGVPIVFPSTCSVYGSNDAASVNEACAPNPLTLYGRSKLEAERAVLERGGIALRPVTAYGPSPCFRPELMPHDFMMQGLLGRTLRLFQPDAVRPLIHIEDICGALLFCLTHSEAMAGKVYNLGPHPEDVVTKGELAGLVAALTGLVVEADRKSSDPDGRSYRVDSNKLHKLGFQPKQTLKDGLSDTLAWMQSESRQGVAAE